MKTGINAEEKESSQHALAFIMQTVTGIQQPGICSRSMFYRSILCKTEQGPTIFYLIIILALYFHIH